MQTTDLSVPGMKMVSFVCFTLFIIYIWTCKVFWNLKNRSIVFIFWCFFPFFMFPPHFFMFFFIRNISTPNTVTNTREAHTCISMTLLQVVGAPTLFLFHFLQQRLVIGNIFATNIASYARTPWKRIIFPLFCFCVKKPKTSQSQKYLKKRAKYANNTIFMRSSSRSIDSA